MILMHMIGIVLALLVTGVVIGAPLVTVAAIFGGFAATWPRHMESAA